MHAADTHHKNSTLAEKLESLYSYRGGPTIDLTIRPAYIELLERLGNPHTKLPPTVHVAGTNGKGSTIAFMRAALEAAGYQAHIYTSPHLHSFNERIVLAGVPITDKSLEKLLDEVIKANKDLPLTFFEITTAMAFLAFSRIKADILLLETGLGGRLDCTNVIEKPLATIITNIGFDHQEFLGETIEMIAREKAGIMKQDAPCIISKQDHDSVMNIYTQAATNALCPIEAYGDTWRIQDMKDHIKLHIGSKITTLPHPRLKGQHQFYNAGAAMTCLYRLDEQYEDFTITSDHMTAAMETVSWPGRLQHLESKDDNWETWFDGGHNEAAARALAAQAQIWKEQDEKPLHLIIGMQGTKDINAFIKPLKAHTQSITIIPLENEPHCHIARNVQNFDKNRLFSAPNMPAALDNTQKRTQTGRILITGSLYLASLTEQ